MAKSTITSPYNGRNHTYARFRLSRWPMTVHSPLKAGMRHCPRDATRRRFSQSQDVILGLTFNRDSERLPRWLRPFSANLNPEPNKLPLIRLAEARDLFRPRVTAGGLPDPAGRSGICKMELLHSKRGQLREPMRTLHDETCWATTAMARPDYGRARRATARRVLWRMRLRALRWRQAPDPGFHFWDDVAHPRHGRSQVRQVPSGPAPSSGTYPGWFNGGRGRRTTSEMTSMIRSTASCLLNR